MTFDEADFNQSYETVQADGSDYDGPNQIYTVLLGDMIEPARREFEGYNHYSLLRTVEKNFDLASLGKNDAASNWFQFLWKQRFQWSAPAATPIASASCIAAASLDDTLYVVTGQSDGTLAWQTYAAGGWSGPTAIAGPATASQRSPWRTPRPPGASCVPGM